MATGKKIALGVCLFSALGLMIFVPTIIFPRRHYPAHSKNPDPQWIDPGVTLLRRESVFAMEFASSRGMNVKRLSRAKLMRGGDQCFELIYDSFGDRKLAYVIHYKTQVFVSFDLPTRYYEQTCSGTAVASIP